MGTKILVFRQTPRGREFSYLCYFSLKAIYWLEIGLEAMKGRKFQSQIFWTECRNFYEFLELFSNSPG